MDLATLLGLLAAIGLIFGAILTGGQVGMFIDVPSVLIVIGGTSAITFVKYPIAHTLTAMKVAMKAFFHQQESQSDLIEKGIELATIARKDGLLGLEGVELTNEFLGKGVQLAVDGQTPELVRKILVKEINQTIDRHERGQHIFKGIGETAPAMGMIGTLIGLVQMMANLDDPKSLGPAMAVALLTTLYGAIIANAIAMPIADKLNHRSLEERKNKSLIIETIAAIQAGVHPQVLEELLKTYLPGAERQKAGDEE